MSIEADRDRLVHILVVHYDMFRDKAEEAADLFLHDKALSRRSANSAVGGQICATEGCGKRATQYFEAYDIGSHYCDDCAAKINGLSSLHPTEGEPVAWVTADILAAMKRGERAVPGWKQSDDFCIPLYAGTRPSNPVSAEVTEEQMVAFRTEFDRWDEGFTTKPRCYMVYRKDDAGEFEVMSKHEDRATMEAALFSARTRAALMASINGGRENG